LLAGDMLKARASLPKFQRVVNVKDSFTRMNLSGYASGKSTRRAAQADEKRAAARVEFESIRTDFFQLFARMTSAEAAPCSKEY